MEANKTDPTRNNDRLAKAVVLALDQGHYGTTTCSLCSGDVENVAIGAKCPHCGEVCDVGANDWWRLYEEGEHEVSCPHCDGDFSVSTRVSYSFSTDEQEDA